MATDAPLDTEMDLVAKADKIAHGFCQRVADSHVFIKLANTDQLVPFGFAGPEGFDAEASLSGLVDELCSSTMANNTPFLQNPGPINADEIEQPDRDGLSWRTSVATMARPIKDRQGKAIGAICAVSRKADRWSEFDQLALELACCQTEKLLASTFQGNQILSLSQALRDYDDIATMIAAHAEQTFSVHSPTGELVFATNALLQNADIAELEAQIRNKGNTVSVVAAFAGQPLEQEAMLAGHDNDGAGDVAVAIGAIGKKVWRARVKNASKHATFVYWELGDA
ncbi:MAG: hypothetical protein AAFY35_02685 [Pseudomonadota bacterium]